MTLHLNRAPRLVRSFLATGESRCPILCVWTLEPSSTNASEDPETKRPTLWSRLLGWAYDLAFLSIRYDNGLAL